MGIQIPPAPPRVHAARRARLRKRNARIAAIGALYPNTRTFTAVSVTPTGSAPVSVAQLRQVPRTLTLVTPDHTDPGQDHLFVGPHAVLREQMRWNADFEDLTFTTRTAAGAKVSGYLQMTHARTRAYGVLHYAGVDVSVEYALAPQRYLMKLARGAAYVSTGSGKPVVEWDPESARWRDAAWPADHQLGFTFGPDGLGTFDESTALGLQVTFDDIASGVTWTPSVASSTTSIDGHALLRFNLLGGSRPPRSSDDTDLFPYQLRVQLTPFGLDFEGGMICEQNTANGVAYGLQGVWDGGHVAGLYRLRGRGTQVAVGVHHRELYIGEERVPGTTLEGGRLTWRGLPDRLVKKTGLPASGHLDFSVDGGGVTGSSFGVVGERISPDEAAGEHHDHDGRDRVRQGPPYTITDLTRMTQFVTNAHGLYVDDVQAKSMEDFYHILQHDMNQDLRRKFINPNLKPLPPAVAEIARKDGSKGTHPKGWYESLGLAYTVQSLAEWSDDPKAVLLNGNRAAAWLTRQTESSDVMDKHGPLLYQNRYSEKYRDELDWFLLDQEDPDRLPEYNAYVDATVAKWVAEIQDDKATTPAEREKAEADVKEFGAKTKELKVYWAFRLFVQATGPAYMNLLQSILEDPTNDGSMFTQQVQRNVALLAVLDPSNTVAQQYAEILQLFQVASLLPQLVDYSGDSAGFNFAVKQIVDAFVAKYLHSEDPTLREAAQELQRAASAEVTAALLNCLRIAAATSDGLYNWALVAERYTSTVQKVLGKVPQAVVKSILFATVGLMIWFCVTGVGSWSDLPVEQQFVIIASAVGFTAQALVLLVKRGLAVHDIFVPGQGFWKTVKTCFSSKTLTKAQALNASGFMGWLNATTDARNQGTLNRLKLRADWYVRQGTAQEAAQMGRQISRQKALTFVFGRNMREFVATRIGACLAAGGIIASAIALHSSEEPLEKAVNSLFLIASALEFIATAGAWGLAAAGIGTIGGMAVSSILAVVSIIGLAVLVAGFITMIIWMTRPQKSPVELFAESSGDYYMPFEAAIDSFQVYQPLSQPQRAGIAVTVDKHRRVMRINSDRSVVQGPLDATGNTAFYARVDDAGRVQIGAPIRDTEGRRVLFALSTDDAGAVGATNAVSETSTSDEKLLWIAEIQGKGEYETDDHDERRLHRAPFKIRSRYWDAKGQRRYLTPDGLTGWKLGDDAGVATVLWLEVVSTAPQGIQVNDILWLTNQHDERRSAGLDLPGSTPRQWSISPALPADIVLDRTTGEIAMVRGADIAPVPPTKYRLTVANQIGSTHADFTLEVRVSTPARIPALIG